MGPANMVNTLPFDLPAAPIDRFSVSWWAVDFDGTIRRMRAVYHVNTPYEALPWTASYCGGGHGAPFVDQWEFFDGSDHVCPRSRVCGWSTIAKQIDNRSFADREAAIVAARVLLKGSVRAAEGRIADARRKLRTLRARTEAL